MATYKNFTAGKWTSSVSKKTFQSLNPATEKPIGSFQASNARDIELAVRAAEKAFPAWRDTPAPARGELLFRVAELLKKDKERLAKLETLEMGKVLNESRGDVQEAIDMFEYMAGEGRRMFGYTTPSELRSKAAWTIRRPIGVVGLITPWNFPIAIPAWKLAPALVCGNSVVFKPSSDTPLCAIELVKILISAGVPPGVVNLVTGSGSEAGAPLVKHPRVRAISFIGSKDTGEWLTKNAGLKRIGLELGGKNVVIVMDDADVELAVEGVVWGAFGTTGQRCTATSRVLVHKKVRKEFEQKLVAKARKLKLGSGSKAGVDVGPLVNKAAVEKTQKYVELGKKQGAKLLCGGSAMKGEGFFYLPTIFTNVKPHMKIAQEEVFGPVLSIIPIKSISEAIKFANDIEYGLSASVYTKYVNSAFEAVEKVECGVFYVNSPTIGAEIHLPFGGVKGTGNGTREAGMQGIEEFSDVKTVYIDYSGKLQKAQGVK